MEITTGRLHNHVDQNTTRAAWRSQQADCRITWIKTPPEQHGDHNRQIAESRGSKHHQSNMEITTGRLHNHVDQNTTRAAWRSQQADCIITWIKTPPEQHGDHNRQTAESRGSKHHQNNMNYDEKEEQKGGKSKREGQGGEKRRRAAEGLSLLQGTYSKLE